MRSGPITTTSPKATEGPASIRTPLGTSDWRIRRRPRRGLGLDTGRLGQGHGDRDQDQAATRTMLKTGSVPT